MYSCSNYRRVRYRCTILDVCAAWHFIWINRIIESCNPCAAFLRSHLFRRAVTLYSPNRSLREFNNRSNRAYNVQTKNCSCFLPTRDFLLKKKKNKKQFGWTVCNNQYVVYFCVPINLRTRHIHSHVDMYPLWTLYSKFVSAVHIGIYENV